MKKITAPNDAVYVSEFMTELPLGILNKKECGCGATHLVLTNNQNVIVAVPLIELIVNKVAQLPGVFGVYGGVNIDDFQAYLDTCNEIKVMVTYDSLPKLIRWINELNLELNMFTLIVDEYHELLKAYSYRDSAIDNLLNSCDLFDKVTFLSATPIAPTYTPIKLQKYDYTEIEWNNTIKIKPIRVKTNKPYNAISNIIRRHLTNGYTELKSQQGNVQAKELYIFLNSVNAIKDLIDKLELTNKQVKVVCSNTERNKQILETIDISSALDENKPITFITAKAFAGVDFYSDSALSIVVSNVSRKSTLLDISTDIFQISGRIRSINNPFKHLILHIFNTGAPEMTQQEWEDELQNRVNNSNLQISSFNKMSYVEKQAWIKRVELDLEDYYTYYNRDTNTLEFNELKMKNDIFMFKVTNDIYTNGFNLRDAYKTAGFNVNKNQVSWIIDDATIQSMTRRSFKELAKEYVVKINNNEDVTSLELECPLLKQAKDTVGIGVFSTCGYTESKIKEMVYNNSNEVSNMLIVELSKVFKANEFYSSALIKDTINSLYNKYKINLKAKASDISKYFPKSEETTKRIEGRVVKGYNLVYTHMFGQIKI